MALFMGILVGLGFLLLFGGLVTIVWTFWSRRSGLVQPATNVALVGFVMLVVAQVIDWATP